MNEVKYSIIIADDHTLFRNGLKGLLNSCPEFIVIGEAPDGRELLSLLEINTPDVILLDIDMPIMDGAEAAKRAMKDNPNVKIITLSMHSDQDYYFKMVSLGVKGFLLKSSNFDEVKLAITTVASGGSYFSQELLCDLVGSLKSIDKCDDDSCETLSQRELEILLLICKGLSNNEIAEKLYISKRTVDKHRANILSKTNSKNTANLVVYSIKNNLVEI